jgi:hypothetical protein
MCVDPGSSGPLVATRAGCLPFIAVIPAQAGIKFQHAVRSTQKDLVSFGRAI